jgi:hypothetical protein
MLKKVKRVLRCIFSGRNQIIAESRPVIDVQIKNGSIYSLRNYGCFQTRADSTIKMIVDALKLKPWLRFDASLTIDCGDYPMKYEPYYYTYCCSDKSYKKYVFPDFIFESWPQIGVQDYDQTTVEIEKAGNKKYQYNQLLWIGNTQTSPNRGKFMEIAQKNNDFILGIDTYVDKYIDGDVNIPYVSLIDHTKYKYLLDIEGIGYSGRIAYLLFTQRVLFIQDREWKQYYYFDLVPYTHFIPVKNDLSDLVEQIKWVEAQGELFYQKVALNALSFAKNNLKYKNAVERIRQMIVPE